MTVPHLLLDDDTPLLLSAEVDDFLLLGGQYYYMDGGALIDENGAVMTEVVDDSFTGNPGDVYIRGTRYSAEGRMYVTS